MIINTNDVKNIYLATRHVDMRKSIDGLSLIVALEFDLDVMNGSLFIFVNRARNRLKMLYYDNGGFWLIMKRLETGRFKVHEDENANTRIIDERQLRWLLDGLEVDQKYAIKNMENRLII